MDKEKEDLKEILELIKDMAPEDIKIIETSMKMVLACRACDQLREQQA